MKKTCSACATFSKLIFVSALISSTHLHAQNAYITKRDNTVSVINMATNAVIASIPCAYDPIAVTLSPDGLKAYFTYYGDSNFLFSVINTNTNTISANISLPNKSYGADGIDISPDGSKLYVASQENNFPSGEDTVYVINTSNNIIIARIGLPSSFQVECIAANLAGTRVYVASKNNIVIIDAINNTIIDTININSATGLYAIAVSPDGSRVYTTDLSNNMIYTLNTTTDVVTPIYTGTGSRDFGIVVSPDGAKVYVTDAVNKTVYVINASTNSITNTIFVSGSSGPYGLAMTPDGSKLLVASANAASNYVYIINTSNNLVTDSINIGSGGSYVGGKFIGPQPGHLCPNSSTILTSGLIGVNYQWQLSTDSINFTNISDNINYTGTHALILQLNNIPSNWYGYQYRCNVNGINDAAFIIRFENKWLGTNSLAWENAANWGCKTTPDINTDVVINSGTVILNSNAGCRSLTLNTAANFIINTGFALTVTY